MWWDVVVIETPTYHPLKQCWRDCDGSGRDAPKSNTSMDNRVPRRGATDKHTILVPLNPRWPVSRAMWWDVVVIDTPTYPVKQCERECDGSSRDAPKSNTSMQENGQPCAKTRGNGQANHFSASKSTLTGVLREMWWCGMHGCLSWHLSL